MKYLHIQNLSIILMSIGVFLAVSSIMNMESSYGCPIGIRAGLRVGCEGTVRYSYDIHTRIFAGIGSTLLLMGYMINKR